MRCGWSCKNLGSEHGQAPHAFRIRVDGQLPTSWSDRLGGMDISIEWRGGRPVTELIGPLADHAALARVLERLNELHVALLLVEPIEPTDTTFDGP